MVRIPKLLITIFSTLLLGGCAYSPGLYIPDSHLAYEAHDNGLQVKNNSLLEVALGLTRDDNAVAPAFVTTIDANLVVSQEREQVSRSRPGDDNELCRKAAESGEYRVGPQDVLSFTVWDHPELTSPSGAANAAMMTAISPLGMTVPQVVPSDANGHAVSSRGTIFFPYVGEVLVAGHTLEEIRSALTRTLAQHILNPQLDVHVVAYRSKKVYVTGEIKTPGAIAVTDAPISVVDAIARAQGFTPEADAFRARLIRGKQSCPINLTALFKNGDISQNCLLQDGDIVNVPNRNDSRVYVMGEVKGGVAGSNVVRMNEGRMDLAEAINLAGGLNQETSDAKRVFVIRGVSENPTAPLVYHLDLSNPGALLLSTRFALKPLDVVYVATSDITRWNRVVSQILPLVSTLALTNYYATH